MDGQIIEVTLGGMAVAYVAICGIANAISRCEQKKDAEESQDEEELSQQEEQA